MTTTTNDRPILLGREPITMTCRRVDRNPDMEDSADMTHWRCALYFQGRRMSVTFSMGQSHKGRPPRIGEVLDCLRLDAAGYENAGGFEQWAPEYGYDTDSRKAERIYRNVARRVGKLGDLLGARFADFLDMPDSDT